MYLGRSRAGVDCVGLPLKVGHELGLTQYDSRDYGIDPHAPQLLAGLARAGFKLVRDPEPGDMPVLRLGGHPRHVAILERDATGQVYLYHAWEPAGKVIREPWTLERYGRLSLAYRFPGG